MGERFGENKGVKFLQYLQTVAQIQAGSSKDFFSS